MRAAIAIVLTAVAAAVASLILGEYELTGFVSVVAGLGVGFLVSELFVTVGRRRGPAPAALVALLAGASLLWAGWRASGEGIAPYPATAWAAAIIGAATAATRVGRDRRQRTPGPGGAA